MHQYRVLANMWWHRVEFQFEEVQIMRKLMLLGLCVLLASSTAVWATNYSYTVSGKVLSAGVGVDSATVQFTVY